MTEKSLPQPSSPATGRRAFTPYVLIWAALAALSLVYLGLLAAQPAMVADYLGPGTRTAATADAEATADAIAETTAEVRTLRDTIDLFRNELIEVRAQVSSQSDATRDLATRVAALEAAPAEGTPVAEADPKAAKGRKGADTETAALPAPLRKDTGAAAGKDKKAEAKAKSSLETGSVASPAAGAADITFGPPVVKPAAVPPSGPPPGTRNMIGVQIASGTSLDSLRLSWTLLSERHADSFRALEPRYATAGLDADRTYDLIVGPLPTVDEARRLCEELALKATPCRVSEFTGDAL